MSPETTLPPELLATLADHYPDAVVIVGADARVKYANAALSDLFGYEPDELVGQQYDALIPVGRRTIHEQHHATYLEQPIARPMGRGLLLRACHADGYDFDVTIALVPIPGPEPMVAAVVREVTSAQRVIARLSATNELLTAALGGASRQEVEQRSVELVRAVLDSESAWLLSTDEAGRPVGLVAGSGPGHWASVVETVVDMVGEGGKERSDVAAFPITNSAEAPVLVAQRSGPAREFVELDRQILGEFADALAITIELIDARSEVEFLRSMADHDRIARDLHDRVIQRLFAIAMRLESMASGAKGAHRERIGEAVDSLDAVIREIRTTIFDLRRSTGPTSLRTAVATEIDEAALALGYSPSLRFVGSIDDTVDRELLEEAPLVVRELLANVARHSKARTVDVTVFTDDKVLRILVDDDGVGLPASTEGGEGLRNLSDRARVHGGAFTIVDRVPTGVAAEWSAPITGVGD